ncbi:MAG TPA: hypothetical protein VMM58_01070 [Bacteroidota bacterium]|nr:hypothetical protein [Bacteroidota bacterium]
MSLIHLWKSSRNQIEEKEIQQLIGIAGNGHLTDGTATAAELREFLSIIPSEFLRRYAEQCITAKFPGNGYALQDVVNEIGTRLGFVVTPGRYHGVVGKIGFDGLWLAPEGNSIVVEVKATDAFSVDLETIANYRRGLQKNNQVTELKSSILIVIGREDTGNLEAQIRGSKHAWDIRLISVDALCRLLNVREQVDDPEIEARIRSVLVPHEYTRIDGIIDLAFSATEELLEDESKESIETEEISEDNGHRVRKFVPVSFNDACVDRISAKLGQSLVKRSRAMYSVVDGSLVLLCVVSREHDSRTRPNYWFAFHDHQRLKLQAAPKAYVAFGCASPEKLVLIPFEDFLPWVEGMHSTTQEDGRLYWHIQIFEEEGELILHRKKGNEWPNVSKYLMHS